MCFQLLSYVADNNLCDAFQSGFIKLICAKSVLLKVTNDILLTLDSGSCAILDLLDFSAAIDTGNYGVLLK